MRSTKKAGGGAMHITSYGVKNQTNHSFINQANKGEIKHMNDSARKSQSSIVRDKTNFA